MERTKFIDQATKGPHVRRLVVWFVTPDFGAHVVRCPNLSFKEPVLHAFAHIHVSDFDRSIITQETIGWLQVAMANLLAMKVRKGLQALDQVSPDHLLINILAPLLVPLHLFSQVAVRAILHNYAQFSVRAVQECFKEANNVWVSDGGKEADLWVVGGLVALMLFLILLRFR